MVTTTKELEKELNTLGSWYYIGRYAINLLAEKYLKGQHDYDEHHVVLSDYQNMMPKLKKLGIEDGLIVDGRRVTFTSHPDSEPSLQQIGSAWVLDSMQLLQHYSAKSEGKNNTAHQHVSKIDKLKKIIGQQLKVIEGKTK